MDLIQGRRLSWALQQQQRHEAHQAGLTAATAGYGATMTGSVYELMCAALWADRRTLKAIKSIKAKVEAKRGMLDKYNAYIEGAVAADSGAQDEIIMAVLLWSFDTGDLDKALWLSAYALKHGMKTPDRYERDTAAVVAEQTAEEVLDMIEPNLPPALWPAALPLPQHLAGWTTAAIELTNGFDMHDQIKAKLFKAHGYALRLADRAAEALAALQQALDLHAGCGVKKDIERLARTVRAAAIEQHTDTAADHP